MATTEWLKENSKITYPFLGPLPNDREFEAILVDFQVALTNDFPDEAVCISEFEMALTPLTRAIGEEVPGIGPIVSESEEPPVSSGDDEDDSVLPSGSFPIAQYDIDDEHKLSHSTGTIRDGSGGDASITGVLGTFDFRIKLSFDVSGQFFDSVIAEAVTTCSSIGEFLVVQWYTSDVIATAVLYTPNMPGTPLSLVWDGAALSPSCVVRLPIGVTGITAAGASVPGGQCTLGWSVPSADPPYWLDEPAPWYSIAAPVTLAEGYNCKLETVTNSEFKSPFNDVVRLSFIPGAGMGRTSGCVADNNAYIRYINGIGPNKAGRFDLGGDDCIQIQGDIGTYPSGNIHGLYIATTCSPCCQCSDYERSYAAVRKLMRNGLTYVASPLQIARGNLFGAVMDYNNEVEKRDAIFFELRVKSYTKFQIAIEVIIANSRAGTKDNPVATIPAGTPFKLEWDTLVDSAYRPRYALVDGSGEWQMPGLQEKADNVVLTTDFDADDPFVYFALNKDIPEGSWWVYTCQFHWYDVPGAKPIEDGMDVNISLSSDDAVLADTVGVKSVDTKFYQFMSSMQPQ